MTETETDLNPELNLLMQTQRKKYTKKKYSAI